MTDDGARRPSSNAIHLPDELIAAVKPHADAANMTVGSWVRQAARNAAVPAPTPAPDAPAATGRPGAREALAWLAERVDAALELGRDWPWPVEGPTVVVGAGGSHPAADYLARLLRDTGIVARAAVPLDADGPERHLVAVTYSARTPDVAEAVRRAGAASVTCVTGHADRPIAVTADAVWAHRDPAGADGAQTPEGGFISMAATVAPCAGAYSAAHPDRPTWASELDALVEFTDADGVEDAIVAGATLDVVGTGWAWPTVLDLESTWVEAALGPVCIHESKNYSHGRYQSVARPGRVAIHVIVGDPTPYDVALGEELAATGPVLGVHAHADGALGGLAALYATQRLGVAAGLRLGVDISRPARIDPGGVRLHHWDWAAD